MGKLERVLEPEVMDTPEEARDYNAMDHAEVNRVFVTDLLTELQDVLRPGDCGEDAGVADRNRAAFHVLDLGAGTAQIPIELCRRAAGVRVTAVDAATAMLAVAGENVARAALADRIELQQADAKALPYADGAFDAVISNSIVHHISEPRRVLAEATRVARTGGLLFFRDLLRPADQATLERLVDTYAAGANARQRRMFAESLHAALALDEIQALVAELGFAGETVRQTTDRHWTWIAWGLPSAAGAC